MNGSEPVATHDMLGGVANAVDFDRAGPGEPAAAAKQVDAVVRQPALLAGVGVVRNHEVAPGQRRRDVDLRRRRRVVGAVRGLARAQQRLGRNAGPVGAFATDQFALDERDAQAALRERAGAVLARRAAADDDDVVVAAHVGSGLPACSRYHVLGVPARPVRVVLAGALLVLAVRGRRASQRGREIGRRGEGRVGLSTRPGNRAVISCSSQPLPSGSLKDGERGDSCVLGSPRSDRR